MRLPENLPLRYNIFWSISIIRKAIESTPRAWEILVAWMSISEWGLGRILASGNADWAKIRTFSHLIDEYLHYRRYPKSYKLDTKQMLSIVLENHGYNLPEWLLDHLTARLAEPSIEEQVFLGGTRGGGAPPSPLS